MKVIHKIYYFCPLCNLLKKLFQNQMYLQPRNLWLADRLGTNSEVYSECETSEKSSHETVITKKHSFSIFHIQVGLIKQRDL